MLLNKNSGTKHEDCEEKVKNQKLLDHHAGM